VGGAILLADVRLDLDDPADATAGIPFPNEARADQGLRDLEGRPAEERTEVGQDAGVGAEPLT
jgi:hypothetical protein